MSAIDCLRRARELLAGGWVNGHPLELSQRADGTPCWSDDEGVSKFSVSGALRAAASNDDELLAAWSFLKQVTTPRWWAHDEFFTRIEEPFSDETMRAGLALTKAVVGQPDLEAWLADPKRKLPEVLRQFDLATARAAKEAA